MGKDPKSNLRPPWKPGESGNPNGRPALSEEEKRLRKLTKEQVKEVGDILVGGNLAELKDILANPNSTVLQLAMAKAVLTAFEKGEWGTVNLLLDRLIGKPKEELEVSTPRPTIIELGDKRIVMGTKKDEDEE